MPSNPHGSQGRETAHARVAAGTTVTMRASADTFHASEPSVCSGITLAATSVPTTVPTEPTAKMTSSRPVDVRTRLRGGRHSVAQLLTCPWCASRFRTPQTMVPAGMAKGSMFTAGPLRKAAAAPPAAGGTG